MDTAIGFHQGNEFLRYIAEHDRSKTRWDNLETGAFVFWYRGSPRPLTARFSFWFSDAPILGSVWTDDPPLIVSGMTLVTLNPLGRLTELIAVPPQVEQLADAAPSPDWAPLFSAAGLDPSDWPRAQPTRSSPVDSDSRAAWTGSLAGRPDIAMRIEAAAYRGKPVYFELIGPWTRPERMQPYQETTGDQAFLSIFIFVFIAVLVGGAMLARRNLRLGRGDRQGAFRLAAFVFVAWTVAWFLGAHHVPSFAEIGLFIEFLVWGSGFCCFTWLLYMALEPYVRRRWPATLISWSRLLAGGHRDPLVGRDVLIGCLLCAATTVIGRLLWFAPQWLGYPPPQPLSGPEWAFLGARPIIAGVTLGVGPWLLAPLTFLFVLVLLRALLRNQWAAGVTFVLLFTIFTAAGYQFAPVAFVSELILWVLVAFVLIRFGLLAIVSQGCFYSLLVKLPLTTRGSAWYAGISLAGILLMAALALYGFYTSLGGRPVFGGAVIED